MISSLACHEQKEKWWKILLIVAVIIVLIILDFTPTIQDRRHSIEYKGVCISVSKFDIDYGVSLSVQ